MDIEELLATASARIKNSRSELQTLLPDQGSIDDFAQTYATTLFANVASNLKAVEALIDQGLTSSAAVILRTVIFGSIRLAWLADADEPEELQARVVEFNRSSLAYERGLLRKAKRSSGDPDQIDQLSRLLDQADAEVDEWKSQTGTGKRSVDEIAIAEKLGDMGGLITTVAILDQFVHVNRVATNAALIPHPEHPEIFAIGDRPSPLLVRAMITAAMQALAYAARAWLKLIQADDSLIEQVESLGNQWIQNAIEAMEEK